MLHDERDRVFKWAMDRLLSNGEPSRAGLRGFIFTEFAGSRLRQLDASSRELANLSS